MTGQRRHLRKRCRPRKQDEQASADDMGQGELPRRMNGAFTLLALSNPRWPVPAATDVRPPLSRSAPRPAFIFSDSLLCLVSRYEYRL
jgi:hypothetical protein